MNVTRMLPILIALSLCIGSLWGADVILNEYNAVDSTDYLNGGDAGADESGGRASDSYFGRVEGNGGDWFELVVIKDHLDMRRWKLEIWDDKKLDETLVLTDNAIWSDLRIGTIITVAEDVPSDVSYSPAGGDWWINVQANSQGDGIYISKANFKVSSRNWQLKIRNSAGDVVFGPVGEGVSPLDGVSGTNVFKLRDDPSESIAADSTDYGDGRDLSTFGAPNRWGVQDFNDLRAAAKIAPATASIEVLLPNDASAPIDAGDIVTVKWKSEAIAGDVLIEFSPDYGTTWSPVYPPNVGNTGQYRWLVPLVESDLCLIRVSSRNRPAIWDISDEPFVVQLSIPTGRLTGDFSDLVLAWL